MMKISTETIDTVRPESEIYNRLLKLDGKHILELGCGNAVMTRDIATAGSDRKITALEVDRIAHEKNLQIEDLPNATFLLAGAEAIPLEDESVDVVFMFKSLHHVPVELMDQALGEIWRVLNPGDYAYISEPVYAGDFNDILRMFHDEKEVREAAFDAVKRAVEGGQFRLAEELFFKSPMQFENFADFENSVLKATHTEHRIDEDLYQRVKTRFEMHLGAEGARFLMPVRVDLLQKAGA